MVRKATSFALIGLVNLGVDSAVFFALLRHVTSSLVFANVGAWAVAVSLSYILNAWFTFAAESQRAFRLADYLKFVAAGAVGMVAATATLLAVALFAPVWIAKLASIGVSFAVNFLLAHKVVFATDPLRKNTDR